jgi:hypothetical protein
MAQTRRAFLQTAAMAIGAAGTGAAGAADSPRVVDERTNRGQSPGPSPAQVPTMRFGGAEISRLIVGCNPFYGFSHFNNTLSQVMKEYYSAERVCDVLHQCARPRST